MDVFVTLHLPNGLAEQFLTSEGLANYSSFAICYLWPASHHLGRMVVLLPDWITETFVEGGITNTGGE